MSTRLVPAYVERPAWAVYDAYMNSDDFEDLRDAVTELRDALVRGQALTYAPSYVLAEVLAP